jgi:hypothetical protein
MDSSKVGEWDISYLKSVFDYELDPSKGDEDPNALKPNARYVEETGDDDYDPIFGPSNPVDTRTVVGTIDSYMVDEETRDESMLTPEFHPDDTLELNLNEEIRQFRKSLDIIETYQDAFLAEYEIPRHVAKWVGYPELVAYPPKNYTNNRFTRPEHRTDFDSMTPYRARKTAVEYARAKNAEWLPVGVSAAYHKAQRAPYEKYNTLVGTLQAGDKDPAIVQQIQPALKVLGSIADLLSIEGKIFRFHYHGLMKNKYGMQCWTQTLIRDCGVECDNVIFETGFRKRDKAYDGGDAWYGPY